MSRLARPSRAFAATKRLRPRRRAVLALLALSSACVSSAQAFESTLGAVPCRPMPEKTYRLLGAGIESWQPSKRFRKLEEKNKAEALAVFERWRAAPWPDLTGLGRVRVDSAKKTKSHRPDQINAWRISGELLLLDDFTVRPVGGDKVTPLGYADELREMAAYAEASVAVKTVAEGRVLRERPLRFVRGMWGNDAPLCPRCVPFHHAYAAALLGHDEAVAPLVRAAMHPHGGLRTNAYDALARSRMRAAMLDFGNGSSRKELLAALEEAHELYPESKCDWELVSLIGPLKRDLAEGPPAYVRKRPEERSKEEQIRALIYELRETSGYGLWGRMGWSGRPDPARRLVEVGRESVPYLIEALEDYTPTRARGSGRGIRLLRRMDVAMHTIEAIAGCDLYHRASTSGEFHNDTPERRSSAVANVKKWWAMSRDASQAEMIRNQLSLWETNKTLRIYERRTAIYHLALIAGPDGALDESDEEIDACVAAISGADTALRRRTVAGLGQTFDHRVQRALLGALGRETEPADRIAILRVLAHRVRPWHLPAVAGVMEQDTDATVRVEAARTLSKLDLFGNWWNLEPCLAAAKSARRIVLDGGTPREVRRAAAEVLMGRCWSISELVLLRGLADDPAFRDFAKLHSYLRRMDEALERTRAAKEEQRKRR